MYSFLNVLSDKYEFKKTPFKEFDKENNLLKKIDELEKCYENITTTEIWSENTLTSSLNQILYFFKIKIARTSNYFKILSLYPIFCGEHTTRNQKIS